MFSFNKDFVIVPIDKAANNVAFICKHFYALTIIKELNPDSHLRNPKRLWYSLFQQQVLVYVHTSFHSIGLCNIGRSSYGCID